MLIESNEPTCTALPPAAGSRVNQSKELVEQFVSLAPNGRAPCSFALLYQHGREMHVSPSSATFEPRGEMKDCYRNAFHAMWRKGLLYCEGYAVYGPNGIPVEHAWLCDEHGQVIDPTWTDGCDYFGVAFSEDFHAKYTTETGFHGMLCNVHLLSRRRLAKGPQAVLKFLESGLVVLPDACSHGQKVKA